MGAVGPTGLEEADINLVISQHIGTGLEAVGLSTLLTRQSDVNVALGTRCEIANDWAADYFVSVHCNSDGASAFGIETLYKTQKGEALAAPIQEKLVEMTGDADRGLKYRSDLYVLNSTAMPAVLSEIGFISHPDTEALLKTDEYRRLIADAMVAAIVEFLNLPKEGKP